MHNSVLMSQEHSLIAVLPDGFVDDVSFAFTEDIPIWAEARRQEGKSILLIPRSEARLVWGTHLALGDERHTIVHPGCDICPAEVLRG